jgi:hypothetical protein
VAKGDSKGGSKGASKAGSKAASGNVKRGKGIPKRTSIGLSPQSRPKNKNKRRLAGKRVYRGQGR